MFRRLCLIALLSAASGLFVGTGPTEAAEFITGPLVTVDADEVMDDDVYAAGGTIAVKGTINGDLVTAGGNINLEGSITGDIIAAGGNINITGPVQDDLRMAGGQINIASTVAGDAVVAGGSVLVTGTVGGDLIVGSGNLNMSGTVAGDARIGAGEARIDGTINGNVEADVENQLTIGPKGRIEGNLDYTGSREVKLETGAQILGQITRTVPDTSILGVPVQDSLPVQIARSLLSQLRWFLGITLVGLLLLWLFPRVTGGVAETPLRSPWKSLGLSVTVLIVAPIALLIIGVISLVVGGFSAVPILLVPGATYLVLLTLAAPVIAMFIGTFLLRRLRGNQGSYGWKALLLGAGILALVGLIPFLNVLASVLTILFGFGAWTLYLYRSYVSAREAQW